MRIGVKITKYSTTDICNKKHNKIKKQNGLNLDFNNDRNNRKPKNLTETKQLPTELPLGQGKKIKKQIKDFLEFNKKNV